MKPGLQFRLSQQLTLTPQLQQSIRLLQLSTLELQQEVDQMLAENPFIEADAGDDGDPSGHDLGAQRAADQRASDDEFNASATSTTRDADADVQADTKGLDQELGAAGEREEWSNGTEGDDFDGIRESTRPEDDESATESQDRADEGATLADHLRSQAVGLRLDAMDRVALHALIDSLDEDGYLKDSIEDIAASLDPLGEGTSQTMVEVVHDTASTTPWAERLVCARGWLQSMDPRGVGASDLADCLVLQLRAMPKCEAQMIAILVAKQHLEALAKRDVKRLMVATGADEALLKEAHALIMRCEPKPGRAFARTEHHIVVPDVIVRKSGRGFKVTLNPDVMPKLRINDLYAQALRGQRDSHAAQARLQEARWFLKNIKQRFDTILRVASAIVERQKGFLTHGEIAMRPLVLREIADELGMHESTISRVTTAKYMATPQGTLEMKYFFGSSLNTEAGGNASSTAVRALIKQLVGAENVQEPLSDNQLATLLGEQGIQVARRTVAKYREALRIAPANLRRSG